MSERLHGVLDQWMGREKDRERVAEVVADLGGLAFLGARAPWREVERVLEARFEWERLPLDPLSRGAVHVGVMMRWPPALRIVAIPASWKAGTRRPPPDPFLLDAEREAVAADPPVPAASLPRAGAARPSARRQLSLFDDEPPPARIPVPTASASPSEPMPLPPAQTGSSPSAARSSARSARPRGASSCPTPGRCPHRPRAHAVAVLRGRRRRTRGTLAGHGRPREDRAGGRRRRDAARAGLDRSERDRRRVLTGGREAALAISGGSGSSAVAPERESALVSPAHGYDGLVAFAPRDGVTNELAAEIARKLDPVTPPAHLRQPPGVFARCGFQYSSNVCFVSRPWRIPKSAAVSTPSSAASPSTRWPRSSCASAATAASCRWWIDRSASALDELADAHLDALVREPAAVTALWEKERARFKAGMRDWFLREVESGHKAVPAHLELAFGVSRESAPGEPHLVEPLAIDLGDGRTLRVSGKIDRIDRRPDGTLVLRDYKTGRAPRDDGGLFRGGKQLQIPFYILAAARMFPEAPVVEAFLDYVDAGARSMDPAVVRSESFVRCCAAW